MSRRSIKPSALTLAEWEAMKLRAKAKRLKRKK